MLVLRHFQWEKYHNMESKVGKLNYFFSLKIGLLHQAASFGLSVLKKQPLKHFVFFCFPTQKMLKYYWVHYSNMVHFFSLSSTSKHHCEVQNHYLIIFVYQRQKFQNFRLRGSLDQTPFRFVCLLFPTLSRAAR